MTDSDKKYLLGLAEEIERNVNNGKVIMTMVVNKDIVERLRIIAGE